MNNSSRTESLGSSRNSSYNRAHTSKFLEDYQEEETFRTQLNSFQANADRRIINDGFFNLKDSLIEEHNFFNGEIVEHARDVYQN